MVWWRTTKVFGRCANPSPPPVPLDALFSRHKELHAYILAGDLKAKAGDHLLMWKALRKEVAQGLGQCT